MQFWQKKVAAEGELRNDHYQYLYTEHWALEVEFYQGKRILDIGCGPRGSLEWADMAAERIGLDALVERYRSLGIDKHKMKYEACRIEDAPWADGYFDVVCSINSLDHIDDLGQGIAQIKRLVKPGGLFLLLVEVNHAPNVCEPISLDFELDKLFEPEFEAKRVLHFEQLSPTMRENITGPAYDHTKPKHAGVFSGMFVRR